ncbi:YbjN domain-containing protein [Actinocatenispora rupis]|uniref:Sensory transduction regulator n=1 Tax=Actinocatenispora rupis TaxID=519421 RepID=A0A8J3NAL5_9ACTN|nr:YbjN domain-containing protein [Actinocatenispora rupis]GID12231.1 hypothetical protein Aru02nite_31200 [Actinocatenispora rupis]
MTTDPSSTPAPGDEIVVPDRRFVEHLLDEMELSYVVDEDGDLAAPFEHFRTYFMFRGEDTDRTFSVRAFYDRAYPIEMKPRLLEVADDWNRRTLWPKLYSFTTDDGVVRLIGEAQMSIGVGVGRDHFRVATVNWTHACTQVDDWLVQQLGGADRVTPDRRTVEAGEEPTDDPGPA